VTFELYKTEDGPYIGESWVIGPCASTEPDGQRVFATFAEAKRELISRLDAEAAELRDRLQQVRYMKQDARKMRLREILRDR
jgi:hypothetical protein